MVSVIFTPRWFHGIDCIFEGVAVLVALMIAFYSYKLYSYTEEKKHLFFSLSFLGISLAFVAKILTNLSLVTSTVGSVKHLGYFIYGNHTMALDHLLYVFGFLGYRILMVLGLIGVYFVVHSFQAKKLVMFSSYLAVMLMLATTFSTAAYPIFYVTIAILLLFIAQFYYDVSHGKRGHKKNIKAQVIMNAFAVIMLAQIVFTMVFFHLYFYVIAEAIQLAGFVMLLRVYYQLVIKSKGK